MTVYIPWWFYIAAVAVLFVWTMLVFALASRPLREERALAADNEARLRMYEAKEAGAAWVRSVTLEQAQALGVARVPSPSELEVLARWGAVREQPGHPARPRLDYDGTDPDEPHDVEAVPADDEELFPRDEQRVLAYSRPAGGRGALAGRVVAAFNRAVDLAATVLVLAIIALEERRNRPAAAATSYEPRHGYALAGGVR